MRAVPLSINHKRTRLTGKSVSSNKAPKGDDSPVIVFNRDRPFCDICRKAPVFYRGGACRRCMGIGKWPARTVLLIAALAGVLVFGLLKILGVKP